MLFFSCVLIGHITSWHRTSLHCLQQQLCSCGSFAEVESHVADLMGFFGAIGFAPTTFWLPSLIWLVVKKPAKTTFSFWFNTFNIVLCVTVMFLAAIGSMYWIVRNASGYKFYQ